MEQTRSNRIFSPFAPRTVDAAQPMQRVRLHLNPPPNLQFVADSARAHLPFVFRGAAETASPLTADERLLDYVNARFGEGDGLASIIFEADVFGRYSGDLSEDGAHIPPEAMVPPPPMSSSSVTCSLPPPVPLVPGDPGYKTRRQRKAGYKRAGQRALAGPVPRYKMRPGVLRHIFPEEVSTPLNGRTIPHSKPGWVGLRSAASHLIAELALEALLEKGYRYVPWDGRCDPLLCYMVLSHPYLPAIHWLLWVVTDVYMVSWLAAHRAQMTGMPCTMIR